MKEYIVYKCRTCSCEFIIPKQYIRFSNKTSCPYGHKNVLVTGTYDSVKECMDNHAYKRVNRRIRQIK